MHSAASIEPQLKDPAWRARVNWSLAALLVLLPMLVASEFKPWTLFDAQGMRATAQFLASFWPPKLDAEFLALIAKATWQTIAIATAGMTFALLLGIPLALIVARTLSISAIGTGRMGTLPSIVRQSARWLLVFLRSIPELVWALLFVRVVGLGPTAGVLAVGLSYAGMIGKVYAEILESNDAGAAQAILRNGGSRAAALSYGLLPQLSPELVSYGIYRWECAIRGSVIMGFVGAGGLGQQIELSMKMLAGGEVVTMLAVFMLLVLAADLASSWCRRMLA
jgi:phosphonate transport system permease protein